jgi:hypothetical protein
MIKNVFCIRKIEYININKREFYKGQNILVRATQIYNKTTDIKQNNKEKEIDDWYIRQRGER